nr:ribosomal protein L32 [Gymnocarpos przewalskii]
MKKLIKLTKIFSLSYLILLNIIDSLFYPLLLSIRNEFYINESVPFLSSYLNIYLLSY